MGVDGRSVEMRIFVCARDDFVYQVATFANAVSALEGEAEFFVPLRVERFLDDFAGSVPAGHLLGWLG